MFQGDAFQSDAFMVEGDPVHQGGDPAPIPMIGLILQPSGISYIIQIIMNQLRNQGIA